MKTMRAIVVGPGNQPRMEALPEPELLEQRVVVEIRASALNHRDIWITKGLYPGIRLGAIMGSDGCGILNGEDVIINPGLEWGNRQQHQSSEFRVLGVPDDGTFADKICISAAHVTPRPAHLTSLEAAALPLAGVTAYRALFSRAAVQGGEKVLITGIGGGVALMAMQFAIALGCEVYVTSSQQSKIDQALQMGAKAGWLYSQADWPAACIKETGGIDVVIDGACGPGFNHLIKCMAPGGRIAFYGATAGPIEKLNPQVVFWKQLSILGSTMGSPADFHNMVEFVNQSKVKPVIDKVFSLQDSPAAFARMAEGKQFGKIVFDHSL
jgi:zinc-binding alcohol dehydrogenase/oxidoreductase